RSAARVLSVTDAAGGSDDGRFGSLWPQHRQLLRLVRNGGTLHVPTRAVADQIRSDLKVGGDQVAVIPIGITPPVPADEDQASAVIDVGRPFVLAEIDTWSVHEQLDAIAAFEELASRQAEIHLVLLGAANDSGGEVAMRLAASGWSSRIIRAASVGERGRRALLGRARVVLHLAERDGLGVPVLDAMAAGTPVVAVRSAPMRELAEGAVLMAEAGDRDAIAVALNLAVTDEAARSVLVTAGRVRAADHSWAEAAGSLIALYRRLAAT
ncbi:MAG: glycosyltransferase, partial [Actinomycetes bacterium]